jgi:hypothetical protein
MEMNAMKDLLVKTQNPAILDQTVQSMGAIVCEFAPGAYEQVEPDVYRVRCFGDPGFVRFAITQQGYGEVIGEEEIAPPDSDPDADLFAGGAFDVVPDEEADDA